MTNIFSHGVTVVPTSTNTELKVLRLIKTAQMPRKSNPDDAGYDLCSVQDLVIDPGKRAMVKTGLVLGTPSGYVGLIWPRSGLAVKKGIDTLAGVVDSGYRGEVCVVLQNHGDEPVVIEIGDRIAQLLVQAIGCVSIGEVTSMDESDRGTGGFGSTGR